ncbi:uncharacterized protein B0H64DRAFT_408875 [Chaetomium fimeti]|uniref:Zn(2)-C6 fungal-type domain-containing protein n=1 Tax=Chaetomium fimeti TaxID=1854472 RepID=A0AAE0LNG7_9PEZI|nr:hypothetical protein B0H64DRAFT_408875 [Chaetomium fimeti]
MTNQQQDTLPLLTERLRSSCNPCGTAKVKCNRGQPQCHRCAGMGLDCVYGVTRKSGKPPRKRLAYTKRPPTAITTLTAMTTPTNDAPNARDTSFLRPRPSDCLGPPSSIQPSDLMMTDIPIQPDIANGVDDHNSLEPSFFVPQSSSMFLDNWDLDLGPNLSSFVPATFAPDERDGFSLATPSVSTEHDCPLKSFQVFRDLTAVPSLSEENADTILAQLDRVLQANRNAIDRLTSLLKCSCVKPPYLIMLHSSIISRILGLYQQAAGSAHTVRRGPAAETAQTAAAGSSPASSYSTPASGTTINTSNAEIGTRGISDEVAQLPFSLGRFSIEDPCVQFAFKNLLIGNELKRAGSLIGLFASQSAGDNADGLRSSLSAWLRADHSSTVRILRSAIKELNDGIDL